jgi:predicted enzyme related to lactoylglutathione lyase
MLCEDLLMQMGNLTIDCVDPDRLALFWADALGWQVDPMPAVLEEIIAERPELQGARAAVSDPMRTGLRIWFQRVPEPKGGKNRMHLDCLVGSRHRETEINRLLRLGATVVAEVTSQLGHYTGTHLVMADPEGNEFCLN